VLSLGNAAALGTSIVSISGGGAANETLNNTLTFSGTSTIAAAHGTTLDETGVFAIGSNSTLNFGAAGEDGVVIWDPGNSEIGLPSTFNVVAGTLEAASGQLGGALIGDDEPTTVDAGATLDLGGFGLDVNDLLGAGTVTDSGAAATLTLDAANFSGAISGPLSLAFYGDASLSGLEDTTGGATLNGSVTVANAGTYDIVANASISGNPASTFINNGLFEKTGGGGVSDVTTNFVNGGTLNVLSGSVQFSGGFTNNGVIHGLVTQTGGVTTISAPVPSDFNGDGFSDILLQNTNGQPAIWEMDGATPISQQTVGANPGPSWQAVGTGDFNGDGDSDILFQNTDGQVAIWEMNGTTPIDQQLVGANPGPSWQAIGTGDFNGDGDSDILFQNTDGQVAIWEMNGTTPIAQAALSLNPGPSWQAVGTGDFNGDGDSDILFQNTNGQVAIWEMNGTTPIAQAALSLNPGPSWKAIGTGDYYGDGHSDILFQNTTSGQAAIWEMNGLTPISQDLVSSVPGADWQAIKS
jgi:hypothetical protein